MKTIAKFPKPYYKPGQKWRLYREGYDCPRHIYRVDYVGANHIMFSTVIGTCAASVTLDYVPGTYVKLGEQELKNKVSEV